MKTLLLLAVLLFPTSSWALSLQWDTVSTDIQGVPLSPGNEVTKYRVYGCASNSCTPANAAFIADVLVDSPQLPTKTFDITTLPKPQTYFITTANLSGESAPSNTVRVTPATNPKNVIVIP